MTVRVCFREVGEGVGGFAFDAPDGTTVVLDPALSVAQRVRLCAELLTDSEFVEVYPSALSA